MQPSRRQSCSEFVCPQSENRPFSARPSCSLLSVNVTAVQEEDDLEEAMLAAADSDEEDLEVEQLLAARAVDDSAADGEVDGEELEVSQGAMCQIRWEELTGARAPTLLRRTQPEVLVKESRSLT